MQTSNPAARRVARAITAALWIVGSAYLIRSELAAPSPDPVVVVATPVIWLVVIALPILVGPAIRSRQYVAAALLIVAAMVGSAYTLSGTIARQSEARDARVARAAVEAGERRAAESARTEAVAMLAGAQSDLARECRSGAGKRCSGIKATIAVYEAAVAGHDAKLASLKVESPAAGESRIAAAIAIVAGGTATDYAEAVALFLPALLGITLEIGALAAAMFGFHGSLADRKSSRDTGQTSFPATVSDVDPRWFSGHQPEPPKPSGPPSGPKGGKRIRQPLPDNIVSLAGRKSSHPVIAALHRNGGSVSSNIELAAIMGVTPGESTKRVREVADMLTCERVGKELRISLKPASVPSAA